MIGYHNDMSAGVKYSLYGAILMGMVAVLVFFSDASVEATKHADLLRLYAAGDASGLFEEGELSFEEGERYDLGRAQEAYSLASILKPDVHPYLWYQLGRVYFLQGFFPSALRAFNQQRTFFGEEVPAVYYMIGLTYGYQARQNESAEDWRRAELAFKRFLEIKPISPWARTDLAWVYFSQGKYEDMKPVLEQGLEDDPDHPWLLNMYGLSLLNTGEKARAREYFTRALEGASKLTAEDWGRAYPGNDPASWQKGLDEMRIALAKNVEIATREE